MKWLVLIAIVLVALAVWATWKAVKRRKATPKRVNASVPYTRSTYSSNYGAGVNSRSSSAITPKFPKSVDRRSVDYSDLADYSGDGDSGNAYADEYYGKNVHDYDAPSSRSSYVDESPRSSYSSGSYDSGSSSSSYDSGSSYGGSSSSSSSSDSGSSSSSSSD